MPTRTFDRPRASGTSKSRASAGRRKFASTRSTLLPLRAIAMAMFAATVDLPSPGFGLVMSTLLIGWSEVKSKLVRNCRKASARSDSGDR